MEYSVEPIRTEVRISEYVDGYVDFDATLARCSECSDYGTTWSCPPFDFDPVALWKSFDVLQLYGYRLAYRGERTLKEMEAALWKEKKRLDAELREMEMQYPGSMALSLGSCRLCKSCTRAEGGQCRHPKLVRHSIESIGGNVGKTLKDLCGIEIEWAAEGSLPEHFVLVGGLLRKED
jgi:predicted metal-binding protein